MLKVPQGDDKKVDSLRRTIKLILVTARMRIPGERRRMVFYVTGTALAPQLQLFPVLPQELLRDFGVKGGGKLSALVL